MRVSIKSLDSCWEFQGAKLEKGYGRVSIGNKVDSIHRLSYQLFIGPIPKGFQVCHRCDNPKCINPFHLFTGSNTDNMRDASIKGRLLKKICINGHPYTKENTILGLNQRRCRKCREASRRKEGRNAL